jgi:hypothetical protein
MSTQIIELINASILQPEEKEKLSSLLEKTGDDDAFYELFNELLIKEAEKKINSINSTLTEYNQQVEVLESAYNAQDEELNTVLEKQLESIDPSDIKAQHQALDDYNTQSIKLQSKHKMNMESIVGKLMIQST